MAAVGLALPLLLAGQGLYTGINSFVPGGLVKMHASAQMEAYRQFGPRLASVPGPVLSDDMVLQVRAGKDIVYEPATMGMLTEVGTWDDSRFAQRIEAREFGLIVVSRPDIWDPRLLDGVRKVYQLDGSVGRYQIYRPR